MLHLVKRAHKRPKKDGYDIVLYFFMIATPLFELPQAYKIFTSKDATGVSLTTWGFFFISSIAWIIYGIRHKIFPLIITYSLYLVIEAVIVAGILHYS